MRRIRNIINTVLAYIISVPIMLLFYGSFLIISMMPMLVVLWLMNWIFFQ